MAARAVTDACCGGDPTRLRRVKARFARPVLPGNTLTTRGWPTRDNAGMAQLLFETSNQDSEPVLQQGLAEYER
jgi:acyl dehydratase